MSTRTKINYAQDLPPSGGYSRIVYWRIPPKKVVSGIALLGFSALSTVVSFFILRKNHKKIWHEKIENISAQFAIQPIILAEKDRQHLKQLRRNREVENQLMKDVEGWETGKWQGENIYKSFPENTYFTPSFYELHAFASNYDRNYYTQIDLNI